MHPPRTHPRRVLGRGDGTASLNSKPKNKKKQKKTKKNDETTHHRETHDSPFERDKPTE